MFDFLKWREIYFGRDINEFFRIQNLLRNESIEFKTKTENNGNRLANDVILGEGSIGLSRAGIKSTGNYTILVKQAHLSKASLIIQKNK